MLCRGSSSNWAMSGEGNKREKKRGGGDGGDGNVVTISSVGVMALRLGLLLVQHRKVFSREKVNRATMEV